MNEEYVKFNTGKLAKDKGFHKPTHNYLCVDIESNIESDIDEYGDTEIEGFLDWNDDSEYTVQEIKDEYDIVEVVSIPSQSDLQKWLRKKFKKHITIYSKSQESWMYRITLPGENLEDGVYGEDFDSFEDALEDALLESLKNI